MRSGEEILVSYIFKMFFHNLSGLRTRQSLFSWLSRPRLQELKVEMEEFAIAGYS